MIVIIAAGKLWIIDGTLKENGASVLKKLSPLNTVFLLASFLVFGP